MPYAFTPKFTYSFTGANQNPLPSPWESAPPDLSANNLQQSGNVGIGTSSPLPIPAVSAMLFTNPRFLPPYRLIGSPCYAQVTIASLVHEGDASETSIDIILRATINATAGFSTEISRAAAGGYHFDCVSLSDDQLVFSQDFTEIPKSGDVIIVSSVGTTQAVFLNGTLMVSGTSAANPGPFDSTVYLQINSGVTLSDPSVTDFVVGSVSGSL